MNSRSFPPAKNGDFFLVIPDGIANICPKFLLPGDFFRAKG